MLRLGSRISSDAEVVGAEEKANVTNLLPVSGERRIHVPGPVGRLVDDPQNPGGLHPLEALDRVVVREIDHCVQHECSSFLCTVLAPCRPVVRARSAPNGRGAFPAVGALSWEGTRSARSARRLSPGESTCRSTPMTRPSQTTSPSWT